ncbi:MAG: hypothetical protein RR540_08125 [Oscillospiraceae bacterium]
MNYIKISKFMAITLLRLINSTIRNEKFNDYECIEEIISLFKNIDIDCGNRHKEP